MATTFDGSAAYFVSRDRLRQSTDMTGGTLYRLDAAGVTRPAQRLSDSADPGYVEVSVSHTGDVRATTLVKTGAPSPENQIGEVVSGDDAVLNYGGFVQISRNARFVVGLPLWYRPSGSLTSIGPSALFRDLATGVRRFFGPQIQFTAFSHRQAVSDTGLVVFGPGVRIISPATEALEQELPTAGRALVPIVNAAGDFVVYETITGGRLALYSIHIPSGKQALMFVADNDGTPWLAPHIQDDGSRVVALGRESRDFPRQWLLLIPTGGGEARWLAYQYEGYREAVLSGDGRVIYAVTEHNRLLRIDSETERVTELTPRVPWIARVTGAGQPGARNRLLGGAFADATIVPAQFPAPTSICGIQVELGGRPMPILKVSPTEIVYQIPWDMEAPQSRPIVRVPVESTSPFAGPEALRPFPSPPEFEDPPGNHLDGKPITVANPIVQGETVDLHMTGFAVPGLVTGVPAPESPPLIEGASCEILRAAGWRPVEVIRFRQAPGQAGLFELRVRFDDFVPRGAERIRCRYAGREAAMQFPLPPR